MSRHGYDYDYDDCDPLVLGRWRAQVASAIRGRRGQKLLRDMRDALDAMPDKRLISKQLEEDGQVCALGAVGVARGVSMAGIDPEDADRIASVFDIAEPLVREISYENDESGSTPEQRWSCMRVWAERRIKPDGKGDMKP